ncbi:hypothetical protein [Aeromonas enteropelogenes]|uniref:hypothetical protein n=1 Tax=Aeromonas enteropelogenes TaxID=29489 RepID=UPI003F74224E
MNRISVIGLWVGIIASIVTIAGFILSVNTDWNPFDDKLKNSNDFLGIWQSKYSYPVANGTTTVQGTTEYFKNGKYNVIGVVTIDYAKAGFDPIKIEYDMDGTGLWNHDDKNLYITLTNVKSHLRSVFMDNKKYSLNELKAHGSIPKLEDVMPDNISEQYAIINKEGNHITLEADDPMGNTFLIDAYKVDKKFQRQ